MSKNKKDKSTKTEIQIFCYKSMPVRTIETDGEAWFVGKDVAEILGYRRTADALRVHVDEEDKGVCDLPTPGGNQQTVIINESGLYSLILSSKLPSAKKFKHWVTHEVLPEICKTGSYALPSTKKEETFRIPPEAFEAAEKIHEKAFASQSEEDFRNTIALDNVFKAAYGKSALEMAGISLGVKNEHALHEEWDSDGCHLYTHETTHAYTWEYDLLPPLPENDLHMWYEDREAK